MLNTFLNYYQNTGCLIKIKIKFFELVYFVFNVIINMITIIALLLMCMCIMKIVSYFLHVLITSDSINLVYYFRLVFMALVILKLVLTVFDYNFKSFNNHFSFSYCSYDLNNNNFAINTIKVRSELFVFEQSLIYFSLLLLFYIFVFITLMFNLNNCISVLFVGVCYRLISSLCYCYIINVSSPLPINSSTHYQNIGFLKSLNINIILNLLNNFNIVVKYGFYVVNFVISLYLSLIFVLSINFNIFNSIINQLKNISLINVVYCQPHNHPSPSSSQASTPIPLSPFTPLVLVPDTPITPGLHWFERRTHFFNYWTRHWYPLNVFDLVLGQVNPDELIVPLEYQNSRKVRCNFWAVYYWNLTKCGAYGAIWLFIDIFGVPGVIRPRSNLDIVARFWLGFYKEWALGWFFRVPDIYHSNNEHIARHFNLVRQLRTLGINYPPQVNYPPQINYPLQPDQLVQVANTLSNDRTITIGNVPLPSSSSTVSIITTPDVD